MKIKITRLSSLKMTLWDAANEDIFIQDNLLKLLRTLRLCGIWTKTCRLPLPLILKRYTLHLILLQPRVQGYLSFPISSWRAIFLGEGQGQQHSLTHPAYLLLSSGQVAKWVPFTFQLHPHRMEVSLWVVCTTESLEPWSTCSDHGVGVSHWERQIKEI